MEGSECFPDANCWGLSPALARPAQCGFPDLPSPGALDNAPKQLDCVRNALDNLYSSPVPTKLLLLLNYSQLAGLL